MPKKKFADFEVFEVHSFTVGPFGSSTHFEIYDSRNNDKNEYKDMPNVHFINSVFDQFHGGPVSSNIGPKLSPRDMMLKHPDTADDSFINKATNDSQEREDLTQWSRDDNQMDISMHEEIMRRNFEEISHIFNSFGVPPFFNQRDMGFFGFGDEFSKDDKMTDDEFFHNQPNSYYEKERYIPIVLEKEDNEANLEFPPLKNSSENPKPIVLFEDIFDAFKSVKDYAKNYLGLNNSSSEERPKGFLDRFLKPKPPEN